MNGIPVFDYVAGAITMGYLIAGFFFLRVKSGPCWINGAGVR